MMRVTTAWTSPNGGPGTSTMFVNGDGSLLAQDAVNAIAAFWNGLSARIATAVDAAIESDVYVINAANGEATGVHSTAPPAVVTSGTVDQNSAATQGLVRWLTGVYLDGRQVRGRTYIPGPMESDNAAGRPGSAWLTPVQAAANTLVGTGLLGVWRRPLPDPEAPNGPPLRAGSFHLVNAASAWGEWAVLRSRRN
jgi:hypothetical protein